MAIPPGWYQDLEDASRLRWWDGEAWTSATREREALDGPPSGPSERIWTPGGVEPDASHVTSAAAAAAAGDAAARLAAIRAPSAAPAEGTTDAPVAPRASRTVRIDDRELGHLLDVVPDVPAHLLPLPAERPPRASWAHRAARARDERSEDDATATVPHVTLSSLAEARRGRAAGRPTIRSRDTGSAASRRVPSGPRAPSRGTGAPLGRRARLRRTLVASGGVALAVVLAVGFLLDEPGSEAPIAADAPSIDPALDEIPLVPELGAPGADGGPEGEAALTRRVAVALGGPCGTLEVELPVGIDPADVRAWDVAGCDLAPVALPSGQQRWIVVRASLNGAAATVDAARASAERAGADGLLWSSYYASLNPDLWVVFDGPFATRAEAEAAARSRGGGAYERVLSDDEGDRYCIAPGGCTGAVPRD